MQDIGQELAVTKNDIKHLEKDIGEIKDGIEKIHLSISGVYGRMDEQYVRKEDFRENIDHTNKRIDGINKWLSLFIGAVFTLVATAGAGIILTHFK
jgi:hypothetical protein